MCLLFSFSSEEKLSFLIIVRSGFYFYIRFVTRPVSKKLQPNLTGDS